MKFAVVTYRSEAALCRNSHETVEYFDEFYAAWDRENELAMDMASKNPEFGFFMGHEDLVNWDGELDKAHLERDEDIWTKALSLHAIIPADEVGNPNFDVISHNLSY